MFFYKICYALMKDKKITENTHEEYRKNPSPSKKKSPDINLFALLDDKNSPKLNFW